MSLLSAKNFFVKIERGQAVADYQMRDKLILSLHKIRLSALLRNVLQTICARALPLKDEQLNLFKS
jgi:hypothetical protein